MRNIYLFILFSFISFNSISQENNSLKEHSNSIGICLSNWTYDYGIFYRKTIKRNAYNIYVEKSTRIYMYNLNPLDEFPYEIGDTKGFELGFTYGYYFKQNRIYSNLITLGYSYKNNIGTDYIYRNQMNAYIYDTKEIWNSLKIGFENQFTIKSINIALHSFIETSIVDLDMYNYIEIGKSKLDDRESKLFMTRIGLDLSVGYQF